MTNGQVIDVEAGKLAHAEQYGVNKDNVSVIRLELNALLQQGTLIDVDVRGVRQFMSAASFEELGVPLKDMRSKRYRTGLKYLIPPEYVLRLQTIEARIRMSLTRYSKDIEGFRPWRYLKATAIEGKSAYELWKEEWDKLQLELNEAVDKIIEDYPLLQEALRMDFEDVAEEAWAAIRSRDKSYDEQRDVWIKNAVESLESVQILEVAAWRMAVAAWEQIFRGEDADRQTWIEEIADITKSLHGKKRGRQWTLEQVGQHCWEQMQWRAFSSRIVAQAVGKLPSPEKIKATVKATYRTGFLMNQAEVTAQSLLNQEMQLKLSQEEMKLSKEKSALWAMKQAELEHAKQQFAEMASPLKGLMDELMGQIGSDVKMLQEMIEEKGYLPGQASERAKGLRVLYNLSAVQSVPELESALTRLEESLVPKTKKAKGEAKYNMQSVKNALLEIAETTHKSIAQSASSASSSWAALELDD